jgi:ClpP class serine protease
MNFGLSREIYGMNTWCVDALSFHTLSAILNNIQNKVPLEMPETKYNSIFVLDLKSETRLIQREWQLDNSSDFEGIGIINLDGVITKNGGASSYGMNQLSQSMLSMAKDSRIKAFIIPTDSGGGSSAAVEIMVDTINEVKKTKPVYALVTKGGMAGSAAYGIISAATKIYSESEENIVGSVGTMIQFNAKPHGNVDQNGEKTIVLYATKSTMKNKAFEEAINNDNYSLLINELLDPVNETFIKRTLANRPQLEGTKFDNGHTVFSKDAIGTFIDGIASFDQVVEMVLSDAKEMSTNTNTNINNNPNSKMNRTELNQAHPELVQSIIQEGVNAERERVASWEVYREADSKAVSEGIASGLSITSAQSHSFLVAMAQKGKVEGLKNDNAPAVVTNESATVVNAEEAKNEELENAFDFKL